ncbi:MAG: sigma 54-interacting transcriptional regulator [Tissierellales bacterium]|nr:sigma 54-interacting transcriptional regulator [Tissierellales bacterium]MBN2828413.1 sigma 54-interacting transcriptional regulator [Tissierellales bacterium]
MKDKIGFIVPSQEVKERINLLLEKESIGIHVLLSVFDENNMMGQANDLIQKGACAIVARGGIYHTIYNQLNVPVINLNITTEDILEALSKAKNISSTVYLVLEETVHFEYIEWQDLLKIKIERINFRNIDEIEPAIARISKEHEKPVVVGGIVTTRIAKKYNYSAVFIDNNENNILNSLIQVEKFLMDIRRDSEKAIRLESILNNIDDAVIVLSKEGFIEHFNNRAEILLAVERQTVLNKDIEDVIETLAFVKTCGKVSNVIKEINKHIIAVNATAIEHEDSNIGIICTIQDITQIQKLEKKLRFELNKKGLNAKYVFEDIMIYDETMKLLVEKAKQIAMFDNTVMIYGESGTGKELFSQSIHNHSKRKNEPFVAVNCAALSENLLESELFGYEEGAFTGARKGGKPGLFELSHGGTIFLDEINSISMNMQSKLLRVLEEKEVMRIGADYIIPLDTRIIAATNESLLKQVVDNEFRRDLFFRLNVLELKIPPLRERKKEIIPLFRHFISKYNRRIDTKIVIEEKLKEKLLAYHWLGNIRELRNVAERFCATDSSEGYDALFSFDNDILPTQTKTGVIDINIDQINKMVEELIIESLKGKGMSKTDIAKSMGISRTALYKKIKSFEENNV